MRGEAGATRYSFGSLADKYRRQHRTMVRVLADWCERRGASIKGRAATGTCGWVDAGTKKWLGHRTRRVLTRVVVPAHAREKRDRDKDRLVGDGGPCRGAKPLRCGRLMGASLA